MTDTCCPPPSDIPELDLTEDDLDEDELARYAKALGHPARVAILRILMTRETCVCGEIVEELPLAQSTVSQHLKQLKEAGLIRGEIDGPRVCYCVEPSAMKRFGALLELLLSLSNK